MKHLDLFSGIGGFALAVDRVWPNSEHIFCEIDPFCQEVLKKHWPNSKIYGDIRTLTNTDIGESDSGNGTKSGIKTYQESCSDYTDLLTGGFPCQPFSQAGRRKGTGDDRHLWPEMLRVIREFRPRWVIGENVAGLLTIEQGLVFEQVCLDLEAEGYEVQPFVIPAVAVNAPHRRDRVWIVAHSNNSRIRASASTTFKDGEENSKEREYALTGTDGQGGYVTNTRQQYGGERNEQRMETNKTKRTTRPINPESNDGNTASKRLEGSNGTQPNGRAKTAWDKNWLEVATRLCRVDDGLPRRLDRNPRLKALGNAIVPQVAEEIMRAIATTPSR